MMAKTMLIIEDEELLGSEIQAHYRNDGWEVVRAPTLAEARDCLADGALQPHVVISDMNLPDGNALDLLEEISELDQDGGCSGKD